MSHRPLWFWLLGLAAGCHRDRLPSPVEAGMSPAPSGSRAELSRYGVGLMAELAALRQAAEAGHRLTGERLDSIAGAASGLAAGEFRELDGHLSPTLTQTDGGAASDSIYRRLDTLRAEVLVWRVRAGP